jgi:Na+-driven multidrug efflux pump
MAIAIFGVIYRVALFIVMPLNGLSQGMQPIVGYNAGAQNPKRIEKTIRLGLLYALGIGLFFVAISEWFASPLFALFTGKENMIHEGIPALRIVLSMMWLAGIPIAILGIHQALGLKKSAFFLAIMRWLLLIVPISFLLPVFFETPINGIWWAFRIADFLGTFIALGILLRTLYLHGIIHKKII